MDEASLSKLNIAALKAKCKELSLTGYSKLNKPPLVAKLVEYYLSKGLTTPTPAPLVESAIPSPLAQPEETASVQHIPVSRKSTHRSPSPHPTPPQKKAKIDVPTVAPLETAVDFSLQKKESAIPAGDTSVTPAVDPKPKPIKKKTKKPKEPKSQLVKVLSVDMTAPPSLIPVSAQPEHTLPLISQPVLTPKHIPLPSIPTGTLITTLDFKADTVLKPVRSVNTESSTPVPSPPVPTPVPQIASRKFKKFKAPLVPNYVAPSKPAVSIIPAPARTPTPTSMSIPTSTPALVPVSIPVSMPTPMRTPTIMSASQLAPVSTFLDPTLCMPSSVAPTPLDFPATHLDVYLSTVKPITLPPSYRLRRRLHVLALAFSQLGPAERTAVARTGKLGRYAIYLSAFHHVRQDFPDSSTAALLAHRQVDSSSSNLWPYYRARRAEQRERYELVQSSWLGRAWRNHQLFSSLNIPRDEKPEGMFDAVGRQVYGDPEKLRLALRFVMSRLHTALSGVLEGSRTICNGGLGTVVQVEKEVVGFWKVSVRTKGHGKIDGTTTWMVLEATGEPLGSLPADSNSAAPGIPKDTLASPLRPDWAAFIDKIRRSNRPDVPSDTPAEVPLPSVPYPGTSEILAELLRTPNIESYPSGIDTAFRRRMKETEELAVAERYVWSSCVLQGTSGTYRTAMDMCDEFNTGQLNPLAKKTTGQANLFLPLSHHVTSTHLTGRSLLSGQSDRPWALHPSLALVQKEESPDSPDFILRETGQIVGSGEGGGGGGGGGAVDEGEGEGVGLVWMNLLGCCSRGFPA